MHRSAVYLGDLLQALQATGAWQPGMPFPDNGQAVADFAVACGFEAPVVAPKLDEEIPPPSVEQQKPPPTEVLPPPRHVSKDGQPARERRLEFWHVAAKHQASAAELADRLKEPAFIQNAPEASNADWDFKWQPSPGRGLLPWKRLWPFLKGVLGTRRRSLQIDLPQTVKKLALAVPLRRFPPRKRPTWQSKAVLLVDYRPALAPFWDDYDWLIRRLSAVRGKLGLSIIRAQWAGEMLWDAQKKRRWQPPGTGAEAAVLSLGDLSQYHPAQAEFQHWLRLGRQLARRGLRPCSLCPCPRDRWSPQMSRAWSLACWDHGQRLPRSRGRRGLAAQPQLASEQNELQAKQERQLLDLLRLASPAVLVERGLLRDLRLLLPDSANVGTEYDAFQSSDFPGSVSARQFAPRLQAALRRELMDTAKVRLPLFLSAIRILLAHHRHSQAVFGAQEWDGILDMATPEHVTALEQAGLLHDGVRASIRLHWEKLAAGLLKQSYGEYQSAMRPFAAQLVSKLQGNSLTSDASARRAKEVIWRLNHPGSMSLAPWVRPESIEFIDPQQPLKVQAVALREGLQLDSWIEEGAGVLGVIQGRRMTLGLTVEGDQPKDSFKAERDWTSSVLLTDAELHLARRVTLDAGDQRLFLEKMHRPLWASRMEYQSPHGVSALLCLRDTEKHWFGWEMIPRVKAGQQNVGPLPEHGRWMPRSKPAWAKVFEIDEFGLRAVFHIREVPFVLRWIPPGRFLMGSPEDEPGRWEAEGPQHEVTISQGFWLAETPVTQAQWRVVVQEAWKMQGPWKKVLGEKPLITEPSIIKGLDDLPVESVTWHQSRDFCRLLDELFPEGPGFHLPWESQWEYACRAGTQTAFNDGSACTEPEGDDPALRELGWFDKNSGGKTHPVKEKQAPNGWGLHDMHGNVWEWCADVWYDYTAEPQTNPRHHGVDSVDRVVRGGSWGVHARHCRSTFRGWGDPGVDSLDLGLRLAAGQNEPRAAEPPVPEHRAERGRQPEAARRARKP